MTYYFDYQSTINSTIENYGRGTVPINAFNVSINGNSIYFTGANSSYAYTSRVLTNNNNFTIYYIAKVDEINSNNYIFSSLSSATDDFGIGIGRTGNNIFIMSKNVTNSTNIKTNISVFNYNVYALVYNENTLYTYINGTLKGTLNNVSSNSIFYFASFLNPSDNRVYGGSIVRFKQFAFVDGVHNETQIVANSNFLHDEYL